MLIIEANPLANIVGHRPEIETHGYRQSQRMEHERVSR